MNGVLVTILSTVTSHDWKLRASGGTLRLAQPSDRKRNSFKTYFGLDMNGVLVTTLSTVASHD